MYTEVRWVGRVMTPHIHHVVCPHESHGCHPQHVSGKVPHERPGNALRYAIVHHSLHNQLQTSHRHDQYLLRRLRTPWIERVEQDSVVKHFQGMGRCYDWNTAGQDIDRSDPQVVNLLIVSLHHGICRLEWHTLAPVAALR